MRVLEVVASAIARKRADYASLRGPQPPYFVCTECGSVGEVPWTNAILVSLKKIGWYQGETTGGVGACDGCEPGMLARFEKKEPPPRTLVDCPVEFVKALVSDYSRRTGALTAIDAAHRFMHADAVGDLYLCGPVGVGKTRLACSIGNELARVLPLVRFVRVHALLLMLQEGMNGDGEHASLSDFVEPAVLILDDVGVEKGSDYSRRTLQTLYDMRRDVGRRTIWTSNLDLEQLSTFLGDDRLPSRIAGAADVVWLDGDDMRVRRPAQVERPRAGRED